MFSFLKKLTGADTKEEAIKDARQRGAVIIDVRSEGEFSSGHIEGSKNIPLQNISSQADKIKKMNKPVIVCCASGMRSAQAKSILQAKDVEVYNGGGWNSLSNLLKN